MREVFEVEKGLGIVDENGDNGVHVIQGAGVPGGDGDYQDAAPVGSLYLDRTNFQKYQKIANAGATTDWVIEGKLSVNFDAATNGTPAAGDAIEDAIGKLNANVDDLTSAVGIAQGDTDMGVYNGDILTDNQTAKENIQELADYIENNVTEDSSEDGVTTETVVDDEVVDNVLAVEYLVSVSLVDDESRRRVFKILISHNGTASADATDIDDSIYAKQRHGLLFNYTVSGGLSGAGASQVMQLKVASTETNGVNVRARRISVVVA